MLIVALIVIYGTMSPAHCSNNEPTVQRDDHLFVARKALRVPPRPLSRLNEISRPAGSREEYGAITC